MSQAISPAASARACRLARMAGHLPSRCQRLNNPYTHSHCPCSGGTSRHGAPVRVRQRIPSISFNGALNLTRWRHVTPG